MFSTLMDNEKEKIIRHARSVMSSLVFKLAETGEKIKELFPYDKSFLEKELMKARDNLENIENHIKSL